MASMDFITDVSRYRLARLQCFISDKYTGIHNTHRADYSCVLHGFWHWILGEIYETLTHKSVMYLDTIICLWFLLYMTPRSRASLNCVVSIFLSLDNINYIKNIKTWQNKPINNVGSYFSIVIMIFM